MRRQAARDRLQPHDSAPRGRRSIYRWLAVPIEAAQLYQWQGFHLRTTGLRSGFLVSSSGNHARRRTAWLRFLVHRREPEDDDFRR
jgi:hypothetical protein